MDRRILERGNASLAAGALYGVGSLALSCPLCVVASTALIANGIREKVAAWRSSASR